MITDRILPHPVDFLERKDFSIFINSPEVRWILRRTSTVTGVESRFALEGCWFNHYQTS